ncbi:heparan-alpha-glucosaminide N-acetyltransferase-like isoform X2 [Bacillus rossius redtenbacheri]|uniref:heparan-alpha-glucosaminide N-acetyltransferase-like isoform X2 n=1 Tax=Bacillus rossius redtenbacheri TaxID=93214 RepID=UPI002FDEFA7D
MRLRQKNVPFSELENDLGTPSPSDGPTLVRSEMMTSRKHNSRMKSLDEFRGLCIVLMIFVNYGGGQYWFFKHSAWNGLTVADLVFPWFLWVMGVSMALSLRSQLRTSVSRWKIFRKVALRSVVLVMLGVVLNSKGETSVDLSTLRLPGVLQRIGLTYFIVATIETVFMKRQVFFEYGPWLAVQDLLESWLQWLVVLLLVALHCLVTFLLPVEGCPTGYLGPGGVHDHGSAPNCTGGAAGLVDRVLFTPGHLYQRPTCRPVYQTTVPYDPEGLLGTLTSVLIVYLGVHAGRIALCYHYTFSRVIRWMGWALLTGLIAGGLCDFSLSDGVIPVNKNLWSLSFVLATASIAFMLLTILYIQIDVRNNQSIYQGLLRYAGMNAILLYVGHEITRNMFPWSWQPRFHTHAEYLLMNLWGAFLWLLVAFVLHKRNIFLSV